VQQMSRYNTERRFLSLLGLRTPSFARLASYSLCRSKWRAIPAQPLDKLEKTDLSFGVAAVSLSRVHSAAWRRQSRALFMTNPHVRRH
jgi:hypothetical protein